MLEALQAISKENCCQDSSADIDIVEGVEEGGGGGGGRGALRQAKAMILSLENPVDTTPEVLELEVGPV